MNSKISVTEPNIYVLNSKSGGLGWNLLLFSQSLIAKFELILLKYNQDSWKMFKIP